MFNRTPEQAKHETSRTVRVAPRRAHALLACLGALSLTFVAGCGGEQASKSSATTMSADNGAPVDNSGSGEVQSADSGLGSPSNPIKRSRIESAIPIASNGILRWDNENLCADSGLSFSSFSGRLGTSGKEANVYYETLRNGIFQAPEVQMGTLICSTSTTPVWPNTIGPGGDGLSIACPSGQRVDRSTGSVSVNVGGVVGLAGGTYGTNWDGLWNYKFSNSAGKDAVFTIWAVCENRK